MTPVLHTYVLPPIRLLHQGRLPSHRREVQRNRPAPLPRNHAADNRFSDRVLVHLLCLEACAGSRYDGSLNRRFQHPNAPAPKPKMGLLSWRYSVVRVTRENSPEFCFYPWEGIFNRPLAGRA